MDNKSIFIAGAGVSGLVCAILLARAGHSVTIVEKAKTTAPTIRGFKRNGLYFDTGVHEIGAIGTGEILDRYLSHLNCSQEFRYFDTEMYERVRFKHDGSEYAIPQGRERLIETLSEAFPEDAAGISLLINEMQQIYNRMPLISLDSGMESFFQSGFTADTAISGYLCDKIKNDKLRTIFAAKCLLNGVSPDKMSLHSHSLLSASYFFRNGTFKNGGSAFADSLEAEADRCGVKILTQNGLERVSREPNGKFSCLLESDDTVTADNVIFSINRNSMLKILDDGIIGTKYAAYLSRLENTMTAEIYFASSDKLPTGSFVEYLLDSPEMSKITSDDTVYVTYGTVGVNGKVPVTLIRPSEMYRFADWNETFSMKRGSAYKDMKKKNFNELIEKLAASYPEYSGMEYAESSTPLTLRDYMNNPSGSIYGMAHTANTLLPMPKLKAGGIYLTGQGIVAQGIFGAILSGYMTSAFFVGFEKLINDLKNTVIS